MLRSVILILSSYLLVFERRCVFENLALIIKKCVVYGMVHCVYAHPFGSELIYLYTCTLLQFFRKFFALFYFLRLEKAGKNPSHTNNTAVLSLGCFFYILFAFLCAIDTNKIVWSI